MLIIILKKILLKNLKLLIQSFLFQLHYLQIHRLLRKKIVVIYHTGQKFGKAHQEVDYLLFFLITFIFKNMQSLQLILKFYSLSMKEDIFQVKNILLKISWTVKLAK